MPAYKTLTIPTALYPGDIGLSFNAEVVGVDGTAGERFALSQSPTGIGALSGFSCELQWSAAPANTCVVALQVSDNDSDSSFVTTLSHTFNGTEVTFRFDPAGLTAAFARVLVVTHDSNGKSLTARIMR